MTERQIFIELFNICVKDGDPNITLGMQFEYCACIVSNMPKRLTFDELMIFVEGREDKKLIEKSISLQKKCVEKVY